MKEEAGVQKRLYLQAGVGVESYQISGALHLGLSILEDGGRTEEAKEIKQQITVGRNREFNHTRMGT